jgi:hypothetical protein
VVGGLKLLSNSVSGTAKFFHYTGDTTHPIFMAIMHRFSRNFVLQHQSALLTHSIRAILLLTPTVKNNYHTDRDACEVPYMVYDTINVPDRK